MGELVMSQFFGSNQKMCATCAFWTGQRECDSYGMNVKNCTGYGKCAVPNGPFKNSDRLGNTCACFNWEKWPVLK